MSLEHDTTGAEAAITSGARAPQRGFVPEPGDKIGRYIMRDQIAEGGMGVIFTAEDPELGRVVAIKLLHPDLSGPAQEQEQRLQREAQAMAKVSHANLVTVFDVGTHEGQVFIAMEYVVGATLREWLGPKRDWRDIVDTFCAAGRGLAAAHRAGLVHRDFKPANVLVGDEDGVPQVLDFGLVRRAGEPDPTREADDDEPSPREDTLAIDLTRTGSVMGTPAYMAPEQHLGQPTDARSDQFAFCVALYEALFDERPFPGEDAGRVTMAVLENERRAKPKAGDVPDAVYRILDRGLSREPEDRYPAMEPLLEALAAQVVGARAAHSAPGPTSRPWLLMVGIAAVVVAGGALALALGSEDAPPEVQPSEAAAPGQAQGPEGAPIPRPATRPASRSDGAAEPVAEPAPRLETQASMDSPAQDPGTALPGVEEEPLPAPEFEGDAQLPPVEHESAVPEAREPEPDEAPDEAPDEVPDSE